MSDEMKLTINVPMPAVDIVTRFEALRLEPYRDSGGTLTVGWGHTGRGTMQPKLTEQEALEYLAEDLSEAQEAMTKHVKVPLNENQASALISFVFNFGETKFRNSTLLLKLNEGDYEGAAGEFQRWVNIGTHRSYGLTRRRGAEEQLFRSRPVPEVKLVVPMWYPESPPTVVAPGGGEIA